MVCTAERFQIRSSLWLAASALALACGDGPSAGDVSPGAGASAAPNLGSDGSNAAASPGAPGAGTASPSAAASGLQPGASVAAAADGAASEGPAGVTTGDAVTDGEAVAAGAREGLVARLSKREYGYSVLDALGVSLTPEELDGADGGLVDDTGDGVFRHFADKQTSTEQHTLAYFEVAAGISERIDVAALADSFAVCQLATEDCGAGWVNEVGRRLFRRPLDEREATLYLALFSDAVEQGAEFEEAARWVVHALLQAPAFLFHIEGETDGVAGQDRALTNYELAARLASFLWVSLPDAALLDAAANGELDTLAGVEGQVARLLNDPKAQRFTESFITDFSRAHLAGFDGVTAEQRQGLHDSIVATFQRHFWQAGRSVTELFTTTEFVVNPVVSELLGLSAADAADAEGVADVSQLPERVGILSHPGMIAGMGDRGTGSFVTRGKYLMERLLCQNPIAVPVELAQSLEQFAADTAGLNEHEKAALRMQRPECWACHTQFEPFAFGFSRFDAAGRYIGEVDAEGKPLSLAGWVPVAAEADAPHYENFAEYMQILANDSQVQRCMTEHFLDFATGRSPDELGLAHAELVRAQEPATGATLPAMVAAIAQSPLFSHIKTSAPSQSSSTGGEL